jgi:predicted ATPase
LNRTPSREADSYKDVRGSLSPVQRFQLPTSGVAMECEGYSQKEEADLSIGDNGGRVAALLDFLLRRDRKRFFQIVDTLKGNIRGLEDIEIGTPNAHTRRIDLLTENGFRLKADEASVGVRLLLFFVSLAHHPRPPRTILLEEPENGIHPKRLKDVMSLLRAVASGRFADHPAQVIVTTHSPYLLDFVDHSTDQVLVFERQDDGGRVAKPLDRERLQAFLDEFMLGEIWFNEEEAGLVAKP